MARDTYGNYAVGVLPDPYVPGNSILGGSLSPVVTFLERAGISDPTISGALTSLYHAGLAHGWWDKCDIIYPFIGGTARSHAENLKSSDHTIIWHGDVTHDGDGITGDGATGYGDTGYIETDAQLNSAHVSVYRRTAGSGQQKTLFGSVGPDHADLQQQIFFEITTTATPANTRARINTTGAAVPVTGGLRLIMGSRSNAANQHFYSLGADTSTANASGGSASDRKCFVLARNNLGAANNFSNVNLAGLTAGLGMSFAEYEDMAADWQTFQTELGRQV